MGILKWILYGLVLATSTTIGVLLSQKYQKRVEELKELKSALNVLKTKVRFTYAPLKDIFMDISKNMSSKAKKVFEKAALYMENEKAQTSWIKAIEETELNLTKEDKTALEQLGKLLGETDIEGQLNEIELCLTFLETQIDKAEEDNVKNAKLYKSLGAITGIGVVIILL